MNHPNIETYLKHNADSKAIKVGEKLLCLTKDLEALVALLPGETTLESALKARTQECAEKITQSASRIVLKTLAVGKRNLSLNLLKQVHQIYWNGGWWIDDAEYELLGYVNRHPSHGKCGKVILVLLDNKDVRFCEYPDEFDLDSALGKEMRRKIANLEQIFVTA